MLIVFTAIHMSLESSFKEELMDTTFLLMGALLTLYLSVSGDTSAPICLCLLLPQKGNIVYLRSTCGVL